MRIAIIGGGNIGTLMAGEFSERGHEVRVFTSKPQDWNDTISILDAQENILGYGKLALVTSDLSKAVSFADIIMVTYPTFMLKSIADDLLTLAKPGQLIGVIPGNNAEFFFSAHIKRGITLFGLQRVHSVARLKKRGHSVYMLGKKRDIQVATLPNSAVDEVANRMSELFELPCTRLKNYLVETLTPSNPILHTTRICSIFRNWKPGIFYDRNFLFYEEWDIASAELMLSCDDELQDACRALEKKLEIDLSQVRSLREHYESPTAEAIVAKISSIPAFKGLSSPMKEVKPGQWIPDFNSRYFKADFAFGLKAIKEIASLAEAATPNIDEVYTWYREVTEDAAHFDEIPKTLNELREIYI